MGKSSAADERKEIQRIMERYLDTYREFKYQKFERKEVQITGSYEVRYHGNTNVTSDSTADIAVWNVFTQQQRLDYCERVERVVDKLSIKEMRLIRCRYMQREPILDKQAQRQLQMSKFIYANNRDSAFTNLLSRLRLAIEEVAEIEQDQTQ
ncbi:transcriptional regulator [Cohnella herbarum]|uniref:Transcriptional regulator n=1 Tax=Cohnella herbarum TaxID=2728023 RepID=A0A7Z2VQZ2_9BACL|nr:transcriptional regulator [Cohnella herbarum]QJD87594.1 transcriptional regulator [Cohnella herbarum]